MRIINKNTFRKISGSSVAENRPYISIGKRGTIRFNKLATSLLMIEKGDKFALAEDGDLFIGVTDDIDGFTVTINDFGGALILSQKPARFLLDKLQLQPRRSYRIVIEGQTVEYESRTFFRLGEVYETKAEL